MVIELESVKHAFPPLPTRPRLVLAVYPALFANVWLGFFVSLLRALPTRTRLWGVVGLDLEREKRAMLISPLTRVKHQLI